MGHITTSWTQYAPYNAVTPIDLNPIFNCPPYYEGHLPTGCGPVAIAQVWNKYKKPSGYSYPLKDDIYNLYDNSTVLSAPNNISGIPLLMSEAGVKSSTDYGFF